MRFLGLMCVCARVLLGLLVLSALAVLAATCASGQTLEERFAASLQEATIISAEIVLPLEPISDPVPTIAVTSSAAPGLFRTTATVSDHWLVSEPWCRNCPAAKTRFLQAGHPADHILTIAQARQRHGKTITSVPAEYSTSSQREFVQPSEYRRATRMNVPLNGSATPSQSAVLHHLRTGAPHQGKHWQAWHLENWPAEKLYALHDDDHAGTVPTFQDAVSVTVSDAEPTLNTFAAAIAWHLTAEIRNPNIEIRNEERAFGAMLDINADVPDVMLDLGRKVLIAQKMDFPAAGVSLDWTGKTRTLTIGKGRIGVQPGIAMRVKKFGLSKSCTLDAISYNDALTTVTFELTGMLDLTVLLK